MTRTEKNLFGLERLADLAERFDAESVWLDDRGPRTWRDFMRSVQAARRLAQIAGVRRGEIVVTPGEARLESLIWLFGLALEGAVVAPLRESRHGELELWKESVRLDWQVCDGRLIQLDEGRVTTHALRSLSQLRDAQSAGLLLATGGTTGVPKILLHDLRRLLASIEIKKSLSRRVLPLMRFDHIGGLDMAWRALASGQVIVAPPSEPTPEAVAATVDRFEVEVMPATPSFLNLLLVSGAVERHSLRSLRIVPYGAEPMPPVLLAKLQTAFPQVQFKQRFGTSETGVLPVKERDGALILPEGDHGYQWEIREGLLWIKSPSSALGYLSGDNVSLRTDGWFCTGDLVEQVDEQRIRIIGRRAAVINVGGEKVYPEEIESVLLEHPLIDDCVVRGEANPVLGQVPAAEIIWRGEETSALAVKKILHGFLAKKLARPKWPVSIRLVSAIAATANLKKRRFA